MAYHPSVHPTLKHTDTNPYPATLSQQPHPKKKAIGISDCELRASAHTAASQKMYESITGIASFPARGIWKATQDFQSPKLEKSLPGIKTQNVSKDEFLIRCVAITGKTTGYCSKLYEGWKKQTWEDGLITIEDLEIPQILKVSSQIRWQFD